MTDRFLKKLRTNMTDAERELWRHLRAHRLDGRKFRRQQPIGPYIADFVHFGARLIVEADGGQHNESVSDTQRDEWFKAHGFRVLRFWNHEILGETDAVLEQIFGTVTSSHPSPLPNPHPGPRAQREGAHRRANQWFASAPLRPAGGEGLSRAAHNRLLSKALLPLPAGRLVVGYSGGLDSTVLLHALASLPLVRERGLRAIHVHHGLHADADAWAAHCEAVCTGVGIAVDVVRVRVDRADGRGPEGAARAARLMAFRATLGENELLALAHHQDDQAETILLRLLRSAGGDGLAAMRRRSRLGTLRLWRPLLDLPRSVLRDYATTHALRWIEDPSNADAGYDRNFLRHRVLPVLAERWPQATRNLARSAALLAEQSQLLSAVTDAQLDAVQVAADVLSVPGLLAQPRAQRARILRAWLVRLRGLAPPATILATIERDLLHARPDGDALVTLSDITLHRWRDQVHARTPSAALPLDWNAHWDGSAPLRLPDGGLLELQGADRFDAPLTVQSRRGGERIRLPGREHHHALKHVLQDRDVPPWTRARMPLLSDEDGELLAAGDAILSARMDAWLRAQGAQLVWSAVQAVD